MIIRRDRNGRESNTFTFQLQYTEVDVKNIFKELYVKMCSFDWLGEAVGSRSLWSDEDLNTFMSRHPYFAAFPDRHRIKMAEWAKRIALQKRYIVPFTAKPGFYLLSSSLAGRAKK